MTPALDRRSRLLETFQRRFGGVPSLGCRAPGRVDLMGSHTDYNLGYVLTLPIDLDAWLVVRPRDDRRVQLYSVNLDADCRFSLDHIEADPQPGWCNYVKGVAHVLQADGFDLVGFDGVLQSTVPISSGLSSSAALECGMATVFEALGGWAIDPIHKARLCQQAENHFVGVNCGILDQYTSCAGQAGCALLLDCRDLTSRSVGLAQNLQIVICDTRFKRELAGSEYGLRRAQCEEGARRLGVRALREMSPSEYRHRESGLPADVARRCRFILEENERVLRLSTALAAGDRNTIRELCAASFHGAMALYEIGVPAMETMMQAMLGSPGVMGARQAGAGFGGCMVAFVDRAATDAFCAAVTTDYAEASGVRPEVYPVAAAAGAGRLSGALIDLPAETARPS